LPYNVKPEQLAAQRDLPVLVFPDK
jgi:hypothetical protein